MAHIGGATQQQGIALLGAMVLVLIVSLLGTTILHLAGHETISANVGREAAVAQQLADAAGEVVVAWFHQPRTLAPSSLLSTLVMKKTRSVGGDSSFFDSSGRSQFVGTADQPDFRLDARNHSDNQLLNDADSGLFHAVRDLGTIEELKVYGPSTPGLLCTVDATVATQTNPPFRQSVVMQLGALDLPPLRSAVQVDQDLGVFQPGSGSSVHVHWGALKVRGDLVLNRADDIPTKSGLAPVTGQGYDATTQRADRWVDAWVGGQVQVMQLPSGQKQAPSLPLNVHPRQNPIPGVSLDHWSYEQLKRVAKRFGSYYAIDQEGLLYPHGVVESGHGMSPDEVFRSEGPGDHRGLIFIDTLDQAAPRTDNLGVLRLRTAYLEGMVVVQGHIVFNPNGSGHALSVLSPPSEEQGNEASRTSIQLSGVHLNGVLYASGNISVTGKVRTFGAVVAGGTIVAAGSEGMLEVWYDHDLGQGLYRGLPVVFRAPGTWLARY